MELIVYISEDKWLEFKAILREHPEAPTPVEAIPDGSGRTVKFINLTQQQHDAISEYAKASNMGMPVAQYDAIKGDLSRLRSYYDLVSPTNAQSVAAIKAIIRVLRYMIRDQ